MRSRGRQSPQGGSGVGAGPALLQPGQGSGSASCGLGTAAIPARNTRTPADPEVLLRSLALLTCPFPAGTAAGPSLPAGTCSECRR